MDECKAGLSFIKQYIGEPQRQQINYLISILYINNKLINNLKGRKVNTKSKLLVFYY